MLVGKTIEVDTYETSLPAFDPLFVLGYQHLWHRGFPWEWLQQRNSKLIGKQKRHILVQADLWNGDPDIDAMCRMIHKPEITLPETPPFTAANALMPFNSQNTFLHRSVIPDYMMLAGVGRVQDIWGSYVLQHLHPNCVVYSSASVYQSRNEHDLVKDLEDEVIQYRLTKRLVEEIDKWDAILPQEAVNCFKIYRDCFAKSV